MQHRSAWTTMKTHIPCDGYPHDGVGAILSNSAQVHEGLAEDQDTQLKSAWTTLVADMSCDGHLDEDTGAILSNPARVHFSLAGDQVAAYVSFV